MTIRNADLHHNVDYTPYEGMTVTGWPTTVLSRGEIICADGELRASAGRGQFLECGAPEPVERRRRARRRNGHGSRLGGQARAGARRQPRHRLRHRQARWPKKAPTSPSPARDPARLRSAASELKATRQGQR